VGGVKAHFAHVARTWGGGEKAPGRIGGREQLAGGHKMAPKKGGKKNGPTGEKLIKKNIQFVRFNNAANGESRKPRSTAGGPGGCRGKPFKS